MKWIKETQLVEVTGNHFHGTITHDVDNIQRSASLFRYPDRSQAMKSYDMMLKYIEHVKVHTVYAYSGNKQRNVCYLVTEELDSIEEWVSNRAKVLFDVADKSTYNLGLGQVPILPTNEWVSVFGSIIKFLGAIHGRGNFHGKIREGTFFRKDKSIGFANFDTSGSLTLENGMKKDLEDLLKLMKAALQGSEVPHEFADFERRVLVMFSRDNLMTLPISRWMIYNHPVFWTSEMCRVFISKFWHWSQQHFLSFRKGFHPQDVAKWWLDVPAPLPQPTPTQTSSSTQKSSKFQEYWDNIYYFESKDEEVKTSAYDKNAQSILRFTRNALEHPFDHNQETTLRMYKLIWPKGILAIFSTLEHIMIQESGVGDLVRSHFSPYLCGIL